MAIVVNKNKASSNDDIKILIVDDEIALTRRFYEQYFGRRRELNFTFEFSGNGVEALRKIEKTEFAVIITDIKMPKMDGMALLRTLKNMGRKIPTIVLTAYGTEEYEVEARELGVVRVLGKPASFSIIQAAIQEALNGLERDRGD